ncbi:LSU ribosomal protein L25P [Moraxella cuniculi DSM 21768]|uniref:Large ribosomal subunit protein bL25 n=2 Tax=Moraxella cuniculi TaxID=34061 RepID=A0A1N7EEB6_9GAMM|nr:50S ribosomal protein L25/general stress protein Ctc [Moraxella cuniculi]OOS05308.1 50S ribosomal protein L25/general stress protein Ctc [Moraxella cuniculi]SIR86318.1 LSU ribosomal protein L25P [Moraxella cuniculi DSM 21768]VEG12279.1 General stress protein CTC [Moraxella cuniculi]
MSQFTLNGVARSQDQQGKGASRRLRKENLIPAIIYGGNEEPVSIGVKTNELVKALSNDAFFSSVIAISIDGTEQEVIIKALQRHPAKGFPLHVDFQRIVRGQTMNFNVPVQIINEETSVGKKAGGVLTTLVTDIEINCLPRNLPESIEVDVANLAIGDSINLGDIKLPKEVTLVTADSEDLNRTIATMQAPTVETETEASEEASETAEASEE